CTPGASPPSFTPACRPDETLGPNGNCYYVLTAGYPWTTARDVCRGIGTGWHLAQIDDSAENTFVRGLTATANVWIGGEDRSIEGTWSWPDATTFPSAASATPYANWAATYPSGGTARNCLRMGSTGTWTDVDCGSFSGIASVCEGPKQGDISAPACAVGQIVGPGNKCYFIDTTTRTW